MRERRVAGAEVLGKAREDRRNVTRAMEATSHTAGVRSECRTACARCISMSDFRRSIWPRRQSFGTLQTSLYPLGGSLANIGICTVITTSTTISTYSLIRLSETISLPCPPVVPVAQPISKAEGSRLLPAAALHSSATPNVGNACAPGLMSVFIFRSMPLLSMEDLWGY
jgi:hypothetical protein